MLYVRMVGSDVSWSWGTSKRRTLITPAKCEGAHWYWYQCPRMIGS